MNNIKSETVEELTGEVPQGIPYQPQMSKHDILVETIVHYMNNPRAVTTGGCVYCDDDEQKMCAVGRCLKNSHFYKMGVVPIDTGAENLFREFKAELKDKYKGHSVDFWGGLQNLHDTEKYWTLDENSHTTLSEGGFHCLKVMCNDYDINYDSIITSVLDHP